MSFLWPKMLWLLLALPLLVALYVWLLGRRKKAVLRYANLSLVKEAMAGGQRWRRHLPPALFLLALAAMLVAVARPSAVVTLPSQHDLVVLAMDVSRSMLAEDVQPNRITAAQAAARAFIGDQPAHTRIAIVSFAGTASVVQAPTNNREDLLAAIDRFQLQRATAIGNAIVVSLATIFPEAKIDIAAVNATRRGGGIPLDSNTPPDAPALKAVPPGSYGAAVIILLTDGQATTGVDLVEVAEDRGRGSHHGSPRLPAREGQRTDDSHKHKRRLHLGAPGDLATLLGILQPTWCRLFCLFAGVLAHDPCVSCRPGTGRRASCPAAAG